MTRASSKSLTRKTAAGGQTARVLPAQPVEVLSQPPATLVAGRVARIIRLLGLLQRNRCMTVAAMADRLRVSRRTIFRDLQVLGSAGVPFVRTPAGYVLKQDYKMAQLDLGVSEILGLLVLGKIAKAIPHQPLFGGAIEAIASCLAQLPSKSRAIYEDLVRNVSYAPGFVNVSKDDEQHFCVLQSAIDECLVCKLAYKPVGGHVPVHTNIHPLHLHFYKHSWYVLAFSVQHDEVRMFKLARIDNLESTKMPFPPIDFSIDRYLDDAWGIIPGERKYNVAIEFAPRVARNVAEIRWHASQKCEMQPDGSCILRFRVNGLEEMSWWLFSYADEAIVREPSELRDLIREMAERTLEANRE